MKESELIGSTIRFMTPPGWLIKNASGLDFAEAEVASVYQDSKKKNETFVLVELNSPIEALEWLSKLGTDEHERKIFESSIPRWTKYWHGDIDVARDSLWGDFQNVIHRKGGHADNLILCAQQPEIPISFLKEGYIVRAIFLYVSKGRIKAVLGDIMEFGVAAIDVCSNSIWLAPNGERDPFYREVLCQFLQLECMEGNKDKENVFTHQAEIRIVGTEQRLCIRCQNYHSDLSRLNSNDTGFIQLSLRESACKKLHDSRINDLSLNRINGEGFNTYEFIGRVVGFNPYSFEYRFILDVNDIFIEVETNGCEKFSIGDWIKVKGQMIGILNVRKRPDGRYIES